MTGSWRFPDFSAARILSLAAMLLVSGISVSELHARNGDLQEFDADGADMVVVDSSVTPSSISVGDRVEMRVVVRANDPDAISLPDDYPTSQWIEIRSMRLIQRETDREIRVVFSPFRTGTLTMPDIDLGAGMLSGARFRVDSVLNAEEGTQISTVEGPGFLPGFHVLALTLIVVLVGAPFAVYRLAVAALRRVRIAVAAHRANRPYRRIIRVIREINTLFDTLRDRDFYIRLIDEARVYFTARLHPDFMVATANEVAYLLDESSYSGQYRYELNDLFQRGDLVKFASQTADKTVQRNDLETLVAVIAEIEARKYERVRRRATRPVRKLTRQETG